MTMPTYQQLAEALDRQYGLNLNDNRTEVVDLAALAITARAWRNAHLEDIHADPGISDPEMMRANIATFKVVRSFLNAEQIDWPVLTEALTDPNRILPGDLTVEQFCHGQFDQIASQAEVVVLGSQSLAEEEGLDNLLMTLAVIADIYCRGWFGTPWWSDIVGQFLLLAPERPELEPLLLSAPETLDDQTIWWCWKKGLNIVAVDQGFAQWRQEHLPD
jgi:hypothetical protein